ncbi:hypothetical protein E2C01_022846 [Portunus trituberculatus]|uniref:Uncharacterized protein n=1 Tax=Portunus trituberculatus TaxID=210409 RepID=A0A5B7E8E2_PORTR|nr:hypothetical protein [Portunus trituberculatus]
MPDPAPEPLTVEQSSTPRGDGSSPRKRPRTHGLAIPEVGSMNPAPAKKQHRDSTLDDISLWLLQFSQRFDKLESDMAVIKSGNSQRQERAVTFSSSSSSSSSRVEEDVPLNAAQLVGNSPPSRRSPSPPPLPYIGDYRYPPVPYSPSCPPSPSPVYAPTFIRTLSQSTCEEQLLSVTPVPPATKSGHHQNPEICSAPQQAE